MKVHAILSDGYPVTIEEEWFVEMVQRGGDWRAAMPVTAFDYGDGRKRPLTVNPKFISRLWLVEDA